MHMSQIEKITQFVIKHVTSFEMDGGVGRAPELPAFELTPRDYLEFAERDLENTDSTHSLVNAVSNLKRAIDCQLDFFLFVFNLDNLYRNKRLGVDRKLGFLSKSGIFSSKSMEKLNKVRNRLEHHYEVPRLEDIEVYYDLVFAFISVIENSLSLAGYSAEIEFVVSNGNGAFNISYSHDGPSINIMYRLDSEEETFISDLGKDNPTTEDIEEFSFFLKVHHLMKKLSEHQASSSYVVKQLIK